MEKTLVIILSETRGYEVTFDNIKQNVIDELNADVCLCIGVKSNYNYDNPFYKLAKYRFLYDEDNDKNFAESVKYSYSNTEQVPGQKHYTEFLAIKHKLLTETTNPTTFTGFAISTYIHIFFLWFLQKNLKENDLISKYDRFVIMRSDYIFRLPFPKMSLLDKTNIWIPDEEDYGGICDRAIVLSQDTIELYINILERFYQRSNTYYANIDASRDWNMERILKMHLEENNIAGRIKRFPYVMYCVRGGTDTSRWSNGVFNHELGYYIKYPSEFNKSNYYKTLYDKLGVDTDQFYKTILHSSPTTTNPPATTFARKLPSPATTSARKLPSPATTNPPANYLRPRLLTRPQTIFARNTQRPKTISN